MEKTPNRGPLLIIFLTVFIDLIGFGIVFPIISYYAENKLMTSTQIGLFLGAYSLMQFIFAPLLGRWSDKIGRRPVLIMSLFGTAISYLILGLANTFWLFLFSRLLDGISGSTISVAQAYIADITPPEERTKKMGAIIGAAHGLGFALGPALGAFLMQFNNPSLPYFIAGGIAGANALAAIFFLPESLKVQVSAHRVGFRTFSLGYLWAQLTSPAIGLLLLVNTIVILAFSMMESTFSLLAKDLFHITAKNIYGVFFYLGILLTIVQGGLIRPLVKAFGEVRLIAGGTLLMAVSLFLLPQNSAIWWIYLIVAGLAVGNGLAHPCLTSLISQRSSAAEQGEKLGTAQSIASLARFLGPLFGGVAFHQISMAAPYLVASAIMATIFFASLALSSTQVVEPSKA